MAKKTKKDRLRKTNRRRQLVRRIVRYSLIGAVAVGVLSAAGYGAWQFREVQSFLKGILRGGRAGTYEYSGDYRQVGVGSPFDFAGGKLTIDSVRTTKSIKSMFGGGGGNEPPQTFESQRGTWLLAPITFAGNPNADSGNLNPASVRLVDEDAEVYPNQSAGSPAEDLYYETSSTPFGSLKTSDPIPQRSLLIFDVPLQAHGLVLVFLREEEGRMKAVRGTKISLTQ